MHSNRQYMGVWRKQGMSLEIQDLKCHLHFPTQCTALLCCEKIFCNPRDIKAHMLNNHGTYSFEFSQTFFLDAHDNSYILWFQRRGLSISIPAFSPIPFGLILFNRIFKIKLKSLTALQGVFLILNSLLTSTALKVGLPDAWQIVAAITNWFSYQCNNSMFFCFPLVCNMSTSS